MDDRRIIERHAARARRRLPATILPYWLHASRDDDHGGYFLPDDVQASLARRAARRALRRPAPAVPRTKQLVTQARLLWVFSTAHRRGLGAGDDYLETASQGYRFLLDHFRDADHGGYVWSTDLVGSPVNVVKHLYGQAFVVYAFVEYARASGDRSAIVHARELHDAVDDQLHDDAHGGWREHADADWRPVAADDRRVRVARAGAKSANTMLHWVEALTELVTEAGDERLRRSLGEALTLCERHCFPSDPAQARERHRPDWSMDPGAPADVSYGHNVESAWLLPNARRALALEPAWERFHRYLDHTLRTGFDLRRGGVFTSGAGDGAADQRHKIWWVQCEMVAALVDARGHDRDGRYAAALARTLTFVERHMTDRRDGILVEAVEEDGRRLRPRKSGDWKAGYHEIRAACRLVDVWSP